jgi:vacuolar-type H+-ATPase subunit F/Vma7
VSRIVAIGEEVLLEGYALVGVDVAPAADAGAAGDAWAELEPGEVGLVILTSAAREALASQLSAASGIVWVALPD